jgi:hypothetical protein
MIIHIKNKFFISILLFLNVVICSFYSQSIQTNFAFHLINKKNFDDAITYLNFRNQVIQKDTFYYLKAFSFYELKKVDSVLFCTNNVSKSSPYYSKSLLLRSLHYMYLKKYELMKNELEFYSNNTNDEYNYNLYKLELSGYYLLKRDLKNFDSIINLVNYGILTNNKDNLVVLRNKIHKHKNKSPWLAGIFSAVLPGSGKFYTGYKNSALSSFASCFFTAGMAAESFYRCGSFRSPSGIFFSVFFLFFYSGNIVGSVFSAKKYNQTFNKKINNEIYINLHIPVVEAIQP